MKDKRKPFLTLGNSKLSKIANFIVLILLLGYAAGKLGLISPSVTTGYEYTIPASELHVTTQEELSSKLSNYAPSQKELETKLQDIGINMSEFQNNVSMELIISTTQNGFQGLVVEFQSSLSKEKLKPVYDYIAKDIQSHIVNNNG